jgi:hypothetical protein
MVVGKMVSNKIFYQDFTVWIVPGLSQVIIVLQDLQPIGADACTMTQHHKIKQPKLIKRLWKGSILDENLCFFGGWSS